MLGSENAPPRVYLSQAIIIIYECKKMKIPAHTANHYGPINHPLSTPLASTGAAGSPCRINANSIRSRAKGRSVYARYTTPDDKCIENAKSVKVAQSCIKSVLFCRGEFLIENSGKVNSYYRKTDSPAGGALEPAYFSINRKHFIDRMCLWRWLYACTYQNKSRLAIRGPNR